MFFGIRIPIQEDNFVPLFLISKIEVNIFFIRKLKWDYLYFALSNNQKVVIDKDYHDHK